MRRSKGIRHLGVEATHRFLQTRAHFHHPITEWLQSLLSALWVKRRNLPIQSILTRIRLFVDLYSEPTKTIWRYKMVNSRWRSEGVERLLKSKSHWLLTITTQLRSPPSIRLKLRQKRLRRVLAASLDLHSKLWLTILQCYYPRSA